MKKQKWMQRIALLIILSAILSAQTAYAKGSSGFFQQNKDEQIQIEKALAELEALRNIRKLDKEQIGALNEKIIALEDLVAIERRRAEAYKAANAERANANALDDRRLQTYEKFVEDFKAERERLIKETDTARRNGRWLAIGGALFGLALGVFATRK